MAQGCLRCLKLTMCATNFLIFVSIEFMTVFYVVHGCNFKVWWYCCSVKNRNFDLSNMYSHNVWIAPPFFKNVQNLVSKLSNNLNEKNSSDSSDKLKKSYCNIFKHLNLTELTNNIKHQKNVPIEVRISVMLWRSVFKLL